MNSLEKLELIKKKDRENKLKRRLSMSEEELTNHREANKISQRKKRAKNNIGFVPVYFETQSMAFCGKHAINNLIQSNHFTVQQLNQFAIDLSDNQRTFTNDPSQIEQNAFTNGWYTIDVLILALESYGLQCHYVNLNAITEIANNNNETMLIIWQRNHYVSVRRFFNNSDLWVFDSMNSKPVCDNNYLFNIIANNIGSFHNLMILSITDPNGILADNTSNPIQSTQQILLNKSINHTEIHLSDKSFNLSSEEESQSSDDQSESDDHSETNDQSETDDQSESNNNLNEYSFADVNYRFDQKLNKIKINYCQNCNQAKLNKRNRQSKKNVNFCEKCAKPNSSNSSKLRNNQPKHFPKELLKYELSFVEEQLISLVFVNQFVYVRGKGAMATKGHCINFAQDISEVAKTLPHLVTELPIVVFKQHGQDVKTNDLRIRKSYVEYWLNWLINNSNLPGYRDLKISQANLDLLPEDDIADLKTIDTNYDFDEIGNNKIDQNLSYSESDNETVISEKLNRSCSFDSKDDIKESLFTECESTGFIMPISNKLESELITNHISQLSNNNQSKEKINFPPHSNTPLNEFNTPNLASMAFPTLFPDGSGDPFDINESHSEETLLKKIKYLINYCEIIDGKKIFRFAKHSRFILWVYNIIFRHRTLSQGSFYLKKHSEDANMTIDDLKNLITKDQNQVLNNIQRYMANIIGTSSYWSQCTKDLSAIIQEKGAPHSFFTFSYATHHDPYLHKILGIPPNSSYQTIDKYIKEYPHIVNEFFTLKFKEFRKEWLENRLKCTPENGGWIWFRYEWQFRDAIHCHGLIRFGNIDFDPYVASELCVKGFQLQQEKHNRKLSPDEEEDIRNGLSAEKDLIEFHDKYFLCDASQSYSDYKQNLDLNSIKSIDKKNIDVKKDDDEQDLLDLTYRLQRHNCKIGKCIKSYDGKTMPCKYKFPKESSISTHIEYTREQFRDGSYGPWQCSVIPKRINDNRISNFNMEQLKIWRANVDFTLINSIYKVLQYVTKYATKSETKSSVFCKVFKTVIENSVSHQTDTSFALKQIMLKVLGERDITRNEALHQLMGLDMHFSNCRVIRLSITNSNLISKNKKNNFQLIESFIDKYANRARYSNEFFDIINMNFIDFAHRFDNIKSKVNLVKRKNNTNTVIRIAQQFSSHRSNNQYWLYCKFQLLRYKPWQFEINNALDTNMEDNENGWISSWYNFLNNNSYIPNWSKVYEEARLALQEGKINLPQSSIPLLNDNNNDYSDDENIVQSDWMKIQSNLFKNKNINAESDDNIYWQNDKSYFNDEELNGMSDWLIKQKTSDNDITIENRPHVEISSLNQFQLRAFKLVRRHLNKDQQLLLRIEGEGGTGKSHLINAICSYMSNEEYFVSAPTGKAAHLICGLTIHCLLNICPNTPNMYNNLSNNSLRVMQNKFMKCKLIIFDEYSMIGCKMMSLIDKRLRQAKNVNQLFGNLSILLVGDTKQLPPVCDKALWCSTVEISNELVLSGLFAFNSFKYVVRLCKNERQTDPNEENFRNILNRLRNCNSTLDDWKTLRARIKGIANNEHLFKEALYLMYSKAEVFEYNINMVHETTLINPDERPCRIDAIHNCKQAASLKADDFMGLEPYLVLIRSARVMITNNLWINKGITNGAMATLRYFIFDDGVTPPNLPKAIVLEMDSFYDGPHFENKPRHIVINPITTIKETESKRLERTQFPIRLSYAVTIHKCQGMTLNKVRINLGKKEFQNGLTYVALSRVRSINDILIDSQYFDYNRLANIKANDLVKNFDLNTENLIKQTNEICEREETLEIEYEKN